MEKRFYNVNVRVQTGSLTDGQADAYISDAMPATPLFHELMQKKAKIALVDTQASGDISVFVNIFRQTFQALLKLDKAAQSPTVAIGKFTENTGNLNNYQIIRAMLCGIYGFCEVTGKASYALSTLGIQTCIREITLFVSPDDLSVVKELDESENFKCFTDIAGNPIMQNILERDRTAYEA